MRAMRQKASDGALISLSAADPRVIAPSPTSNAIRDFPSTPATVPAPLVSHPLLHLLLALLAVIVLGRVLAVLFAYFGQPPVIGEVLAGICLGPSLLGRIAPAAGAFVLPDAVAPSLGVISPSYFVTKKHATMNWPW